MSGKSSRVGSKRPTSLTKDMGEIVRHTREQAGLTQAELAQRISRRQASLSDIENGRMEIDVGTLIQLADVLRKPVTSFFPPWVMKILQPEEVTAQEEELVLLARELSPDQMAIVLTQVRALADAHNRAYMRWLDEAEEVEASKRPRPKLSRKP